MNTKDWAIPEKPYDLRERLFLFACLIVRVVEFLHTRGRIAIALSDQVLKSGTSAGANYEEADAGSSDRDTLAKRRIVLRELKETHFRLRVFRHSGYLLPAQDPVIQEALELKRILGKLVRNSEEKIKREERRLSRPPAKAKPQTPNAKASS
jgi:four helix bundle protein